jgi:hypothetical protein
MVSPASPDIATAKSRSLVISAQRVGPLARKERPTGLVLPVEDAPELCGRIEWDIVIGRNSMSGTM